VNHWTSASARVSSVVLLLANRWHNILAVTLGTCAVAFLCSQRLHFESGFREMLATAVSSEAGDELATNGAEPTEIAVLAEGNILEGQSLAQVRALSRALRR
jgi:hypothetical protein